jgi:pimeloyl-ACP methyl ester carboxylesterase
MRQRALTLHVVLPDTGHVCNIEAPEEFNAVVRNFLRAL